MMSNAQPDNAGPDGNKNDEKTKFCSCCPLRFRIRFKNEEEREKLVKDKEDARKRKSQYRSMDTGHSANNPSMRQPRPLQLPENEKKVEEIKMETLGLTNVDEIFSQFQSTFNAFYFCQVDMQTAVKDFKTAVNTTGEFRVCLSEFKLQLSGHRVVIKKLAIKFPKAIEKGGGSIADGAKALVSILKTYEKMENLPVKVTRKGVECLKDVMKLDVSELAGEEVGGNVFDLASKISKQVESMRKNMKEIAKAPKIVSEFFKYATSIVMEVIEAFGDPKNKEYLTKKNDKVQNDVDSEDQKLKAVAEPEPPKEIKFTSLGVPTVDRIFNDVAKLVNPVIRLSRDCFDARKSLEKAIKGISEFCDDPSKGFDDYVEELKKRIKKGRVHIKISVNGNHVEIEKVEGLEPRQMQDMESGLKGVIKSGEELFDLAPDSIKKIIALTQDVSKLSKSDIVNHVSLKEVPSKVSTLSENSKKAKKIPGDLKFFLSFMRNLILDIMQVLKTKKEDKDQGSEQGDGNNEA